MSRFNNQFAALAAPRMMRQFGQAAAINKASGGVRSVQAMIVEEPSEEIDGDDGPVIVRRISVKLFDADAAGLGRGDSLDYNAVEWGFNERLSSSGGLTACSFSRSEPVNKTRRGREVQR